jgi:hypothetical protein
VSRTTVLVLVALGAAVAGFAFSSAADRLREGEPAGDDSVPAGPQEAELGWRETYGPEGEQLVFSVDSFQVVPGGWRARVAVENDTSAAYEVGDPRATLDRSFGLMLFATGDPKELEQRNRERTLPAIRAAARYEPSLPEVLESGDSWSGTISARGALVAGSWVRIVFGALFVIGKPPEGVEDAVVWITDHAYRLRR